MIASTLVVGKQLAYVRNRDLGADLKQTLVLKVPPGDNSGQRALAARNRMAGLAAFEDAAVSTSVPGREYANWISSLRRQGETPDQSHSINIIDVDERYFDLFGIPLLAGRTFSSGFASDEYSIVLNEEAAKLLGFESPEKAVLEKLEGYFGDTVQVVGVVKNYHHKSLRDKIEPVLYAALPYAHFPGSNYISLRIRGGAPRQAIESASEAWRELFPGQPLEFSFLDEDFHRTRKHVSRP